MKLQDIRCRLVGIAVAAVVVVALGVGTTGVALLGAQQAAAQSQGAVPGNVRGNLSNSDMWKSINKDGIRGNVSIPDKKAGQLVQRDGDAWLAFKNGPLTTYGYYGLAAIIGVLVLFYLLRGRIRIDHGPDPQGRTIERFNALERFAHWLTAVSFIVLAVSGLNILYGKHFLPAIIGKGAFGTLTYFGKIAHDFIAFPFMLGIVLMFVLWVRHNIPNTGDIKWLAIGGGLLSKGGHPEAQRFNAGQKIIFWLVVLGGGSLSISGLALLMPFEIQPWAGTFALINKLGFALPTTLTPLQETQISVIWHSAMALVMIVVIIAHIYIGSIGMEGAFDAVGSGKVDLNWAKEHHSLWVAEVEAREKGMPAE